MKRIFGLFALLSIAASISMWTAFLVVELLLWIIGVDYNKDLLCVGITMSPTLCFSLYAFTRESIRDMFINCIHY